MKVHLTQVSLGCRNLTVGNAEQPGNTRNGTPRSAFLAVTFAGVSIKNVFQAGLILKLA